VQVDPPRPLRDRVGRIKSVDGLRRAAELLARHLGLPHPPHVKVGYVPWKGPDTPIVDLTGGGSQGSFTIARWAVRGKYRRSWETLEHALVKSIGFWLECHRRDGMFSDKGTSEALVMWYGEEAIAAHQAITEKRSAAARKGCVILLGVVLAVYFVLWAVGIVR
jgi:hypothetical protein